MITSSASFAAVQDLSWFPTAGPCVVPLTLLTSRDRKENALPLKASFCFRFTARARHRNYEMRPDHRAGACYRSTWLSSRCVFVRVQKYSSCRCYVSVGVRRVEMWSPGSDKRRPSDHFRAHDADSRAAVHGGCSAGAGTTARFSGANNRCANGVIQLTI